MTQFSLASSSYKNASIIFSGLTSKRDPSLKPKEIIPISKLSFSSQIIQLTDKLASNLPIYCKGERAFIGSNLKTSISVELS